jgi:hypothetical protein
MEYTSILSHPPPLPGCRARRQCRRQAKRKMGADSICKRQNARNDPNLIKAIEELGEEAFGEYSEIKTIEIPDDID